MIKKVINVFSIIIAGIAYLSISSCSGEKQEYFEITADMYLDKMKGGWVGQMAGHGTMHDNQEENVRVIREFLKNPLRVMDAELSAK